MKSIKILLIIWGICFFQKAEASYHFADFRGRLPISISKDYAMPKGVSPDLIKKIYNLPKKGGHGTIAIIGAYDNPTAEQDLAVFSKAFGLAECTVKNKCFEEHAMAKNIKTDSDWNMETALDVQWAHAIAPDAKILLVEAPTQSGENLLQAVDYAASRSDVVAISMSWGGAEFAEQKNLDSHFVSKSGAVFFASSGDKGWGASWPSASANVVSVGGTSLSFKANGSFKAEQAWEGSGGGLSVYEPQPAYQSAYSIYRAGGMRAIPDVAYNADPKSGFSVYAKGRWYVLGGTSAGAPQWAAIQSLGLSASNEKLYADKATTAYANYFRDIVGGTNGDCVYYCKARKHYDYITGLGSPVTVNF